MVRIPGVNCCGPGSIAGGVPEITQAAQCGKKRKKKWKEKRIPPVYFKFF